jgi:Protein of unknown function (DUF669)
LAKKSSDIVVNAEFNKVTEGGPVRVKEGDYKVKIIKAERGESNAGNTMITFTYEFLEGKAKGKQIKDRVPLTEKAWFRLYNIVCAIKGEEVPKKAMKVNVSKLVGKEMGITVEDDEYENKIYSSVASYLDLETLEGASSDDEDEDDEDEDDEDEDEDEDDDEDEDLDEVDLDEL